MNITEKVMKQMKIKELKKGYGVNHLKYGYLQYRGLAKRHDYTDEPIIPYRYIFWQPVDGNGNIQSDVILTNGNEIVELIDKE